jgi:hypothetical protein
MSGDRSGRLNYKSTSSLSSCTLVQLSANPSLPADTTLPPPGAKASLAFSSYISVDATAPRISSVSSRLMNGIYGAGQVMDLTITFSEAMVLLGGTGESACLPTLRLAIALTNNGMAVARPPPLAMYVGGILENVATLMYLELAFLHFSAAFAYDL